MSVIICMQSPRVCILVKYTYLKIKVFYERINKSSQIQNQNLIQSSRLKSVILILIICFHCPTMPDKDQIGFGCLTVRGKREENRSLSS